MIKKMENYATHLERIVSERMSQLEEAQLRAEYSLLSQVLLAPQKSEKLPTSPPSVARLLKAGTPVEPNL